MIFEYLGYEVTMDESGYTVQEDPDIYAYRAAITSANNTRHIHGYGATPEEARQDLEGLLRKWVQKEHKL